MKRLLLAIIVLGAACGARTQQSPTNATPPADDLPAEVTAPPPDQLAE